MDKAAYTPIAVAFLYEGMVVPDDIYDHALQSMLLPAGSIINAAAIDRLSLLNKHEPIIFVSGQTEKIMRMQGIPKEAIVFRSQLEEQTGYKTAQKNAGDMLNKIAANSAAPLSWPSIKPLALEISKMVAQTEPAHILDLINGPALPDEYLCRHCINISSLNGLLGMWLQLPKEVVDLLVIVGLTHDCGKAALPRRVVEAPRNLTGIELELIKTHSALSQELLAEFPDVVKSAVRGHHEKMDGSGYPDRLAGEDIPYMSRITAVGDMYDAVTSNRCYRSLQNPFVALSNINSCKKTLLDAEIANTFISNVSKLLTGRPVLLSNNLVGIIQAFDAFDMEHPTVKIGKNVIKTNDIVAMYME